MSQRTVRIEAEAVIYHYRPPIDSNRCETDKSNRASTISLGATYTLRSTIETAPALHRYKLVACHRPKILSAPLACRHRGILALCDIDIRQTQFRFDRDTLVIQVDHAPRIIVFIPHVNPVQISSFNRRRSRHHILQKRFCLDILCTFPFRCK
eukprot:scaffold426_cov219-Amphora_coffeaeformis.AAC.61